MRKLLALAVVLVLSIGVTVDAGGQSLALLGAGPGAPTPNRVQSIVGADGSATAATTATATFSGAVKNGNKVLGMVTWYDPGALITLSGVTDNQSNSYTVAGTVLYTLLAQRVAYFYSTSAITNAPTVITATFSGSAQFRRVLIEEWSGIAAFDKYAGNEQSAPGTGTDAVTSTAVTPTTNGQLIWGGMEVVYDTGSAPTVSVGTGYTVGLAPVAANAVPMGTEYKIQSSAASVATTWTLSATKGTVAGIMTFQHGP